MPYAARNCDDCDQSFNPSSRHKTCPMCRKKRYRRPCPGCGVSILGSSSACPSCANSGDRNPKWAGGRAYHAKGYVMVWSPNHPRATAGGSAGRYVMEHTLVMEEKLGRMMLPGENVHHLNGQRNDNRPDNLELWTRPQPTGIRVEDAVAHALEVLGRYKPELLGALIGFDATESR